MSPIAENTQAVVNDVQPRGSLEMSIVAGGAKKASPQHEEHQHKGCSHSTNRLRGGGAGKDCFLGLVGCFLCFECCEGCCDCCADIICCPCEMCC